MASLKSAPLTVFRGFPESGRYVWSPFVTKLEARLRFGKLAYRTDQGSVPNAPKGKVPYVSIEGADGQSQLMADSSLITKKLIEAGKLEDLNRNLSKSQKLQDLALQALLEDRLYFYQVRLIPPPPPAKVGTRRRPQVSAELQLASNTNHKSADSRAMDPELLRHARQDPRGCALARQSGSGQHHLQQKCT